MRPSPPMSALFVQSSLRNTKSFASKFSCLWRRDGAISCIRNLLLWNEGLSCRLLLEVRDFLALQKQFACAVTGSSLPISPPSSPIPPASVEVSGFYSWKVQRVWVRTAICLLLLPEDHLPSPSAPPVMGQCRTEPVEVSYRKPSSPILGKVRFSTFILFPRKTKHNLVLSVFSNLVATISPSSEWHSAAVGFQKPACHGQ